MIAKTLEKELNLSNWQVRKVIKLIDDGNTIPFIARYRKDVTGSLNDETLRKFDERLKYLRNLEDNKEKIIKRINELGKLDDGLKNKILSAGTLVELEDIYRPFKSKKQTRATKAKEKGLETLAQIILKQEIRESVLKIAQKYVTSEVKTPEEAIKMLDKIVYSGLEEKFQKIKPCADVVDFIKKLKDKGFKIGILSDFPPEQKGEIWGIKKMCDVILGAEDAGAFAARRSFRRR